MQLLRLIPGDEVDRELEWFTRFFASCIAIEPTPPAPPIIRIDDGLCLFLSPSFVFSKWHGFTIRIVSEYTDNLCSLNNICTCRDLQYHVGSHLYPIGFHTQSHLYSGCRSMCWKEI